jgi:hypothetical protein
VLRATEYVVPALEIVDARLQDPRKIFDTVADNGAAAGIVVGGRPVGPLDVDLRWVGGIMYRNSEIESDLATPKVTTGPIAGSRKIYARPDAAPDLRVPLREIALDASFRRAAGAGLRSVRPYTDNDAAIDVEKGSQARAHRMGEGARRRRGL